MNLPDARAQDAIDEKRGYGKATLSIALATGVATFANNMWFPFLPLFALEVGATDEADALYWVALAFAVQGIARLVTGPLWGMLSDRIGRRVMFLRALYGTALTNVLLCAIVTPWQLVIVFGVVGVFSGFNPAAVALTSVTVPDSQLKRSLNLVTSAQYLGQTVGPGVGAVLAIWLGYRGGIFMAAVIMAVVATMVIFLVPDDKVRQPVKHDGIAKATELEPFHLSFQLSMAIFLYFVLFATSNLIRVAVPIELKGITGTDVTSMTGIAFTLGGVTSVIGVFLLSTKFFRMGQLRSAMAAFSLLSGVTYVMLAFSTTTAVYVLVFALLSMLQSAMTPTTNTLIAFNVTPSRRGTAFGLASAAQALGFMAGPALAALFAATSFQFGHLGLGLFFFGLAMLIMKVLREPRATT